MIFKFGNILLVVLLSTSTASAKSESAPQLWSKVHQLSQSGKNKAALKVITRLETLGQNSISKDELAMVKGRVLYQIQKYKDSVQAYSKVSKKSDFWLASVEERAWAKVRMGLFNEAIADSKTLMSPLFADIIGPESYFVSSYVAHRVCDFKNVFEITDKFKKHNKLRIVHLEKLARMEKTRGLANFLNSLKKNGLEKSIDSQVISFFPSHFQKNKKIIQLANKASGFGFNTIAFRKVLADLAKKDLSHYSDVIAKLHLIEGDVIQRIFLDKSLSGKRTKVGSSFKPGKYDLQFPYDEKDVWVDEIDSLKVKAKNCPEIKIAGVL